MSPSRRVRGSCVVGSIVCTWWLARGASGERALMTGIAVVVGMYLPALVMVLRRPNEGPLPVWLERVAGMLPSRLRGRATMETAVS